MAFTFEDDLIQPRKIEIFEYKGPNPFRVVGMLPRLLQVIFYGKGLYMYEDDFRWDITADPRPFFVKLRFQKVIDRFTEGIVRLKIWGKQPSDPNSPNGQLLIEFDGLIRTKFEIGKGPFDVLRKLPEPLLYPFLYLYFLAFYTRVRRQYIKSWASGMEKLQKEVRSSFNLMQRESLK